MPPQKKKKLEAAIDNLFSSPRTRTIATPKEVVKAEDPAPEVESEKADPPVAVEQVEAPQVEARLPEIVEIPAVQPSAPEVAPSVEAPLPAAMEAPAEPAMPVLQAVVAAAMAQVQAQAQPAAEVIAAAEVIEGTVQMVIFTLDGQFYGIGIECVDSIIKMQAITELPHAPHYIVGLTNLRGKVLPVISLRRRFGLVEEENTKSSRIIVISVDQKEAGLIVDGVSEVETIPNQNIEPPPAMASYSNSRPIDGIAKLDERLVILLNLSKLISPNG